MSQLKNGMYCTFETAKDCANAFFAAKRKGYKVLGGTYNRLGLIVGLKSGKIIAGSPRSKKGYTEVTSDEFVKRINGNFKP
jgi:hypothetical protein